MNAKIEGETLTRQWRLHCQQQPHLFKPLGGTIAERKRAERQEKLCIDQLRRQDLSVPERAVAFRHLIELRGCTARELGNFFQVDPQVIIAGISLLELPAPRPLAVAPTTAVPQSIHSYTKAA